ncbi:MAG: carbonic anhydrase family protein [Chloroflexales bacterium]|nr:carbonic anhydrase family protein [Chloroflexales bacterium]
MMTKNVMPVLAVVALAAVFVIQPLRASEEKPHWDYTQQGADWAQIRDGDGNFPYATCDSGSQQSPIDIGQAQPADLTEIQFDYRPSVLAILNNGHTIQVNYKSDPTSTITVNGKTYTLRQFHFHTQSEHTRSGVHTPLEMHLVHQSDDGALAVVGVQIKASSSANPAFKSIWEFLPKEEGVEQSIAGVTINARNLLPTPRRVGGLTDSALWLTNDTASVRIGRVIVNEERDRGQAHRPYYTYDGSLTTPACNEGVTWYLLKDYAFMSSAQIEALARIEAMNNNFRSTQPLEERNVLLYELSNGRN